MNPAAQTATAGRAATTARVGRAVTAVVVALLLTVACTSDGVPERPGAPVTLTVLDVAGNLALTKGMIDDFVARNGKQVAKVVYATATPAELAARAGQNVDLVLTGGDGLAAGVERKLWLPLAAEHADRLPGMRDYLPGAAAMQKAAGDYGVTLTYHPAGPLIEFLPATVLNPPRTAAALLTYAQNNPGAVQYTRPSVPGPGRTFLMGLPYLLGDTDPKDPVNGWAKTWAYLGELNRYVTTYPATAEETLRNLADGRAKIVASTTGADIGPRVVGKAPKQAMVGMLDGFHWVADAHYAVVPEGVPADRQAAVLNLLADMLTPRQQAKAYAEGSFYPGPAVKGVTLAMAPVESRQSIGEYGRGEYPYLIASNPQETPLDAAALAAAVSRWDREIGGAKVSK